MERRDLFPILGMAAFQPQAPFQPKFLTPAEAQTVTRLADIIMPGAAQAGVIRFIDLVLYYGDEPQQESVRRGIAAVEDDAMKRYRKGFFDASHEQQDKIVAAMAEREGSRRDELGRFFVQIKRLAIEAYHYSAYHWQKDIGRGVNVALSEFPACNHKGHKPA